MPPALHTSTLQAVGQAVATGGSAHELRAFATLETAPSDHHYITQTASAPSKAFVTHVRKECDILATSLPSGIFIRTYEDRVDLVRCLIVGPDETPFEKAPTLLQLVVSLQSLVICVSPYFEEPGYERLRNTPQGQASSDAYSENTFLLTRSFFTRALQNPPKGFENEIKELYGGRGRQLAKAAVEQLKNVIVESEHTFPSLAPWDGTTARKKSEIGAGLKVLSNAAQLPRRSHVKSSAVLPGALFLDASESALGRTIPALLKCLDMKKSRPAPKERSAPVKRTRTAAPQPVAPVPPPRGPFPFPLDVHTSILSHIGRGEDIAVRNRLLAPLALVSRSWQAATYSLLYGDLRIIWLAGNITRLLESFSRNPILRPMVRQLETKAVDGEEWIDNWVAVKMADPDAERERWKVYCAENEIDTYEASRAWHDEGGGGLPGDLGDDWENDLREGGEASKAWRKAGHAKWDTTKDRLGISALLDFLEATPNLRSLVIGGFDYNELPPGLSNRGPFVHLTALGTPGECPFITQTPPTLNSFLASRAPNLRRLSGSMNQTSGSVTPFTTSLSHLEFDLLPGLPNPAFITLIQSTQSSLRSLTLPFFDIDGATAISPYLASLTSLSLLSREYHNLDPAKYVATFLTSTPSLHHLHLDFAFLPHADSILASLPTSLSSVSFDIGQRRNLYGDSKTVIQKVLDALKKTTSPRPLRVTLPVPSRDREAIMEAFADKFGLEGMSFALI
ncbi:hypothetical protein RQP46_008084 [Phenoliferia psychrophenolica]